MGNGIGYFPHIQGGSLPKVQKLNNILRSIELFDIYDWTRNLIVSEGRGGQFQTQLK